MSLRDWYTIQELAGLPGLPSTDRGVRKLADREGWEGQRRLGSKAIEYNIAVLPEATRAALLKAAVTEVAEVRAAATPAAETLPAEAETSVAMRPLSSSGALSHRQALTRDARLLVVNMLKRLMQDGLIQKTAIKQLRDWAARGELQTPVLTALALGNNKSGLEWAIRLVDGLPSAELLPGQDIQAAACEVSQRTLERWLQQERDGGAQALAPGKREKDVSVKPWVPYLLERMQRPQKPYLSDAWREMCAALPAHIPAPSYYAVRRWYSQKYSNLDKQRGRHQGSALNPHKHHLTRSSDGMLPMQELHSDGWGSKFTAPHPVSGKYVKLEVWHSHDVATRYVFRPSVGLSESMLVIMGSLFNAVAEGGVPAVWQTDNTGSVKNERVSFDPVTSIQARAGIHIVHNLPGNSQANGIAENFNKYLERRARELATYMTGRMDSLAQKKVLRVTQKLVKTEEADERRRLKAEAEKLGAGVLLESFEQASELICSWCEEYNRTPHRALPKIADPATGQRRHQTPAEAWAAHVAAGWQPVAVVGEQLADLFRPHETKIVRRATVTLFTQKYHHAELEHWNGEEVQVAYDIYDGERVWVKNLEGRLICIAQLDSVRGYRPMSVYEMAMNKRTDAAIARHEAHIAEIERQRPVQVISHEAPLSIPGLGEITPDRLQARFAEAKTIEGEAERLPEPMPAAPAPEPEAAPVEAGFFDRVEQMSFLARYQLCRRLELAHEQGQALAADEARFIRTYPGTSVYRSFRRREEEGLL